MIYVNQYITGSRSAFIKNQTHIAAVKLPFLLKLHRNVLWKTFLGETLILAELDSGGTKTVSGKGCLKCFTDASKFFLALAFFGAFEMTAHVK